MSCAPPELLAKLNDRRVVASVSGGKDSAALSLHLSELGIEHDRVFLDTGWEHPATYDYLRGELARVIGAITWLSAPRQMVDLILHKGMFPSKQRRYCTQELKVRPMQVHLNALVASGQDVVNAVGIRHAESAARAQLEEWEWSEGFECEVWRPLVAWSEEDVIAIHRRHGLGPNPLYLLGAERVGCWPCIYARKSEVRLLADVDPARVEALRKLEADVTTAQRVRAERSGKPIPGSSAWFQAPLGRAGECWSIDKVVEWSRTSHGGRQYEMFAAAGRDQGCMRWGLCETADPDGEASK
ncbi:phosphoadenosine phosphosulfate reductase family protein [Myxococcus sp. K38C18041901]|uniref:phosphoadenosine phosphosulfate reductase family protein n=1 Tax=Myxococcus guangdongensis TaxID=2906760 RepID=UPI0020A7F9A1|nr:phosphoadenosine phosphosulfate reductase family protein [Myxococcus guangdongensis]MCP3062936.1 phosphoadenosine phosphosulfate reductase family protein [Myxococcus guangdongensis]